MRQSLARKVMAAVVMSAVVAAPGMLGAQTEGKSLGSVSIPRQVKASGQPLAAGTYTLRLLPQDLKGAVGQTASESRYVEFVQGGKVVGKEVATVLTGAEARAVTKGAGPASGSAKVQLLKGDEYVRVWIRQGDTHYLDHLAVPKA
jgi:hypothetical protein